MTASPAQIFLGVDGGGTGCRAAIADGQGRRIGTGSAGAANVSSDFNGAMRNIRAAISEALNRSGLDEQALAIASGHIGLAGVLSEDTAERVREEIGLKCDVTDDRPTMLAGALGEEMGLLAAIGTGSFFAIRNGAGTRFAGGWGIELSDEASGAWLGRELLAEALRAHDGLREQSDLSRSILKRFDGPSGSIDFVRQGSAGDIAALAPDVVAARDDDPLADELMAKGASEIVRILTAMGDDGQLPLCLAGGLAPQYAQSLPTLWKSRLVAPRGDALDGALILARRAGA